MLIVSGYLTYRPEDRAEITAALVDVSNRSRADAGCVDYWWAEDLEITGRFRFFECWESVEIFEAHRDQPYEREFMARFVTDRIIGADAASYEATARSL